MRDEQIELETPEETAAWREGIRRHEAIRELLNCHEGPLRLTDVKDVAWDLGVSQATLYRLIGAYKSIGTVKLLRPRRGGRPKGLRLLDPKIETIIAKCCRFLHTRSRGRVGANHDRERGACQSGNARAPSGFPPISGYARYGRSAGLATPGFRRLFSSSSRSSTTRAQRECPRSQFLATPEWAKRC